MEVAQFTIHQVVDIEEGLLTMSDGMASAAAVQTRIVAVVECTASRCWGVRKGVRKGGSSV